jgi:5-methylcytosine-specific restriction enzyme subunit McrC
MRPALSIREWGRFDIGTGGLTATEAERFATLAEAAAQVLRVPSTGVLSRVHRGLKAGQICGVLHAGGRTLEILPKIDGDAERSRTALLRMLAVVHDLPLSLTPEAQMARGRHDLLEALIGLFARDLLSALRQGAHRLYAPQAEDLPRLRGALDIRRQFTTLVAAPQRLACRYDELSPDTPLNRLLKAAARLAAQVSRADAHRRALIDAIDRLEGVADIAAAPPVRFDRASSRFRGLAGLARMFLSARRQRADAGAEDGIALLFPMNDLFEAFVGRLLQRHFGPGRVNLQVCGRHALQGPAGAIFALRPDAVIDMPQGPLIVDTKWKALKPEEEKLGVSQADVYQMLAYAEAWGLAGARPRILLLYPHHAALGPEGPLAAWRTHGADLPFEVASFDIGRMDAATNGDALRHTIQGAAVMF